MTAPTRTGARAIPRSRVLLTAAIAIALIATVAVTVLRGSYRDGALEPDAPTPQGSRAVVRVLEDTGTEVGTARHTSDAARALRGGGTVLLADAEGLSPAQLDLLASALDAPGAGHLVLVAPDALTLAALTEDVEPAGSIAGEATVPAGDCGGLAHGARALAVRGEDGALADQGRLGAARTYAVHGDAEGCFDAGDGSLLVSDGSITVLGAADVLTNEGITGADDAALALNLLGAEDTLTWYVPSATDPLALTAPSLLTHLPRWIGPVALWLMALVVVALVAAGRRQGPVVVEPLPVTARGEELVLGRARLLERASERTAAASALRAAAAGRLAARLGQRHETSLDALLAALAPHTALSPDRLRALLEHRPVTDDQQLLRLAHDLDALEKEIDR